MSKLWIWFLHICKEFKGQKQKMKYQYNNTKIKISQPKLLVKAKRIGTGVIEKA